MNKIKITYEITPDDIRLGKGSDPNKCPHARAFMRELKTNYDITGMNGRVSKYFVDVDSSDFRILKGKSNASLVYSGVFAMGVPSAKIAKWMAKFDNEPSGFSTVQPAPNRKDVKPGKFSITLEWPAESSEEANSWRNWA